MNPYIELDKQMKASKEPKFSNYRFVLTFSLQMIHMWIYPISTFRIVCENDVMLCECI